MQPVLPISMLAAFFGYLTVKLPDSVKNQTPGFSKKQMAIELFI